MRLFVMVREGDPTGFSGTGEVADGVEFPDGTVVIRWRGDYASTVVWDSMETARLVHGHGGATRFVDVTRGHQPCSREHAED